MTHCINIDTISLAISFWITHFGVSFGVCSGAFISIIWMHFCHHLKYFEHIQIWTGSDLVHFGIMLWPPHIRHLALFDSHFGRKLIPSAPNNYHRGPFRKHIIMNAACISEGSRDCKISFALDSVVAGAQMCKEVGGFPSVYRQKLGYWEKMFFCVFDFFDYFRWHFGGWILCD